MVQKAVDLYRVELLDRKLTTIDDELRYCKQSSDLIFTASLTLLGIAFTIGASSPSTVCLMTASILIGLSIHHLFKNRGMYTELASDRKQINSDADIIDSEITFKSVLLKNNTLLITRMHRTYFGQVLMFIIGMSSIVVEAIA